MFEMGFAGTVIFVDFVSGISTATNWRPGIPEGEKSDLGIVTGVKAAREKDAVN